MGLDMNLYKKHYVKNWEHMKPDELHTVTVTGKKAKEIKSERVREIVEEVAYWRKANQIHKFFIDNCGDGEDNGEENYVSFKTLQELLAKCEEVMAKAKIVKGKIVNGYKVEAYGNVPIMQEGSYIENAEEIAKILPTQDGFFFGSTEYDEYYMQDIIYTRDMLKALLAEDGAESADYYYSADW